MRVAHGIRVEELGFGVAGNRLAVDGQLLVDIGHLVTGHPDHTLDVVQTRLGRITEHHHVTTLRIVVGKQLGVEDRQTHTVVKLVDQDQVTHSQRGDH
ncbi:hypothetical protein D9M69_711370 [compost metagenome]